MEALRRRLRTQWRPLSVSLRPVASLSAPGQWLPPFDDALSTWSAWCADQRGACAVVDLSAHWMLMAVADDAQAAWQHYYGLSADDLARDWLVRKVRVGASALHCAVPKALIDGVRSTARSHGVQLQWVGPWWIGPLQQHVADQIRQGDSVQPWSATEPGLRLHASLSWDEAALPHVQLRQVWCEAEAA